MDSQEKLEAMFCPRLDSALVASIYNDTQDFKTSVAILSTLAASTPSDSGISNSTLPPAGQVSKNGVNHSRANPNQKTTTSPHTMSKNNVDSGSNNQNILIWSEQVANSNLSSSSTSKTSSTRINGSYKQGQVANDSAFQQATSTIGARQSEVRPAGSGTTSSTQKTSFRAVRNPNYLKKHGIEVEPEELEPDLQLDESALLDIPNNQHETAEDNLTSETLQTSKKLTAQKAEKKSKGRKSKWGPKIMHTDISNQLSDLQIASDSTMELLNEASVDEHNAYSGTEDFAEEYINTDSQDNSDNKENIYSEELEFLKNCFPDQDYSDEYLSEILKDSKRDLEMAVELILSQMFLENEQVETSSTGSGSHYSAGSLTTSSSSATTSSLDDAFFQGVSKSKKKSKLGRGGSNSTWGTSRHTQVWDTQSDALSKTIENQDEFLIPESNDWATFEHQISILMNIFHTVPRATIVSEYHSNGAHLFKTVESLEARFKQDSPYEQGRQSDFDTNLAQLVEMFPDHSTIGLKKLLVYNGGNFQDAMNAVLAADVIRADQPKTPSFAQSVKRGTAIPLQANITFSDKNHVPNPTNHGNRLKSLPSSSNPFPGGPRPFPNTLLDNPNYELYNDEDDPIACRQRAHDLLEQRNELFRKAAQAYKTAKGKGAGMGGIAAYYADEGKKLDSQGKQWHMRAARAVVQHHRHENKDPNLVDLHGLTISEAQTVVREAVTQWFSRSTMQASRIAAKPLKIICGVGSHSKDRIARLYPSILSLLTRDGWRCEAGNGVILVKGVAKHSLSTSNKR